MPVFALFELIAFNAFIELVVFRVLGASGGMRIYY